MLNLWPGIYLIYALHKFKTDFACSIFDLVLVMTPLCSMRWKLSSVLARFVLYNRRQLHFSEPDRLELDQRIEMSSVTSRMQSRVLSVHHGFIIFSFRIPLDVKASLCNIFANFIQFILISCFICLMNC